MDKIRAIPEDLVNPDGNKLKIWEMLVFATSSLIATSTLQDGFKSLREKVMNTYFPSIKKGTWKLPIVLLTFGFLFLVFVLWMYGRL